MFKRKVLVFLMVFIVSQAGIAFSAEQDDAEKAAKGILSLLADQRLDVLWDSHVSKFIKDKITKDSFLANMSLGRTQLGKLTESKLVDYSLTEVDPTTGYKGRIYAFNFLNTYSVGKFYERIVVVKEDDGKFRLSGLWGSPAPK